MKKTMKNSQKNEGVLYALLHFFVACSIICYPSKIKANSILKGGEIYACESKGPSRGMYTNRRCF